MSYDDRDDPPRHRVATIDRPAVPPAAADRGRSRVGDSTRPIVAERRLFTSKRAALAMGVLAVAIAGAVAWVLFAIPLQTYFAQSDTIDQRSDQLARLQSVNDDLEAEVARLRTNDGVREAAREELGYVQEGEERTSIVDTGVVPTVLPVGWPYSLVTAITGLRSAAPAADVAAGVSVGSPAAATTTPAG